MLWVPATACSHPADALFGELDAPRLAIMCKRCRSAWDETNVPGDVVDTLTELLESGAFRPLQLKARQLTAGGHIPTPLLRAHQIPPTVVEVER